MSKYLIDGLTISQFAKIRTPHHDPSWYRKRTMKEFKRSQKVEYSSSDVDLWEKIANDFFESMNGDSQEISISRIENIFKYMKRRCYNLKDKDYCTYGGRGITICDEWLQNVDSFVQWSIDNGYNDKLTIDRIDGERGYSPDNCRWVTIKENCTHIFESMDARRKRNADKRRQATELVSRKVRLV